MRPILCLVVNIYCSPPEVTEVSERRAWIRLVSSVMSASIAVYPMPAQSALWESLPPIPGLSKRLASWAAALLDSIDSQELYVSIKSNREIRFRDFRPRLVFIRLKYFSPQGWAGPRMPPK